MKTLYPGSVSLPAGYPDQHGRTGLRKGLSDAAGTFDQLHVVHVPMVPDTYKVKAGL